MKSNDTMSQSQLLTNQQTQTYINKYIRLVPFPFQQQENIWVTHMELKSESICKLKPRTSKYIIHSRVKRSCSSSLQFASCSDITPYGVGQALLYAK